MHLCDRINSGMLFYEHESSSIGQNYTSCHPKYIIIYRTISSVLAGMSMQPSLFLILI